MTAVIVDTGPIVALLSSKDAHHAWTTELLTTIAAPLLTCEAVVSEACFLVRRLDRGQDAVLALIERGALKLDFSLSSELTAVRKLMEKYSSVLTCPRRLGHRRRRPRSSRRRRLLR